MFVLSYNCLQRWDFRLKSINITRVLTISSLVVKIFTANWLPKNHNIYNIKGETALKIRQAYFFYFGGRVDVFKCKLQEENLNLNLYDINSLYFLYSYVMVNRAFTVAQPIFFYDKNLDNYFGFVFCEIETPENLDKPVLTFRDELLEMKLVMFIIF